MTFSFPPNPSVGDQAVNGSVTYTWDGSKWVSTTGPLVQGSTGPIGATGATGPVGEFDGNTPIVSEAIFTTEEWFVAGISTTGFGTTGITPIPGTGSVAIGPIDNYEEIFGGTPGVPSNDSNLMFNHFQGAPQDNGNSARLSLNSRRPGQAAQLDLAMASNVSFGTTVILNRVAKFTEAEVEFFGDVRVANTLYGDIIGDIDGNVSGNSGTTDKLRVPVNISLDGDVAGTTSFDGSQNVTINSTIQPNSVELGRDTTGDYISSLTTNGGGISVSGSGEDATWSVNSNATPSSTPNALVIRNSSGSFSANVINANTFTGSLNGNAATASKWLNARTITLSGDIGGNVTIDGTSNVTLETTVQPNSVQLGTDTTGEYVRRGRTSGNGISGSTSGENKIFTVTSNATANNTANTIVFRNASGNFNAGTITATLNGNAATASLAADATTTQAATITSSNGFTDNGYIYFGGGSSGRNVLRSDSTLRYQASADRLSLTNLTSTGTITANNINASGTITGNVAGNSATASKLTPGAAINGVNFDGSAAITITAGTNQALTPGSYIDGSSFNGLTARTWNIRATTSNTPNNIVARNGSGTISAGQANLSNVNATGWIRGVQGSATAPTYRFRSANDDNGFYSPGTDIIAASTGGGELLRMDTDRLAVGFTGDKHIRIGSGSNDNTNLRIYKKIDGKSNHIEFYSGTTRMGEIGAEGGDWLRINQETNKNIYTPQMFRADGGFQVDGSFVISATGIHEGNGSGLTNLNANRLSSGTVPDERLPNTISSDISGNAATADRARKLDITNTTSGTYRLLFSLSGNNQTVRSDTGITVQPGNDRILASAFQGSLEGRAEAAISLSPRSGTIDKTVVNTEGMYTDWNRDSGTGSSYFINQRGANAGGWRFVSATTGNVGTEAVLIEEDGRITITGSDKTFVGNTFTGKSANSDLLEGFPASSFIRANANDNVTGNTEWQDNFQVRFGSGNDMRLYHNGTNSFIDNSRGQLLIRGTTVKIQPVINEEAIIANANSSVQLFFNGSEKLRTNNGGVSVTGTLTAGSFSGNGGGLTNISASTININSQTGANATRYLMFTDGTGAKTPTIDNSGNGVRYVPRNDTLYVGTVRATFNGNGASITSLNANNLSSGTVPRARLRNTYDIAITGKANTAGTADRANSINIDEVNGNTDYQVTFSKQNDGGYNTQLIDSDNTNFVYNPNQNRLSGLNYSGNGSGLTSLNASQLSSGTVPRARLGTGSLTYDINITGNSNTTDFVDLSSFENSSATQYITFAGARTGNQRLRTEASLKYTGNNNTITANITGKSGTTGTADVSNRVTIFGTPLGSNRILFANGSGNVSRSASNFTYDTRTQTLTAPNFRGNGSGLTGLPREIPTNTVMIFKQASAPSGWVRVTSGVPNESIMRIRTTSGNFATNGGSLTFSQTFANRGVPLRNHTHGGSVTQNGSHGHISNTDEVEFKHTHGGNTGQGGSHSHGGSAQGGGNHKHNQAQTTGNGSHGHNGRTSENGEHDHNYQRGTSETRNGGDGTGSDRENDETGDSGQHSHSLNIQATGNHNHQVTMANSGNHTHSISLQRANAHTHQVFTNNNNQRHAHAVRVQVNGLHSHNFNTGGANGSSNAPTMDFRVRYVDVIVARKT